MIDVAQFIGGPAKGKTVRISRVPRFLRVAISLMGELRVLDALDAVPETADRLHVYQHLSKADGVHDGQPAKVHGYFHAAAPDRETMQDTAAWQAWCIARSAR